MLISVITRNFYHNTSRTVEKKQILENFEIRDMSEFNVDEFCNHLNLKLSPLFDENSCSVNEVFNRLISIFGEVVDQFAPKRKAS